jgi:ankyrin repeat protein
MGRTHRAARMGKTEEVAQCLAQGEDIDAIGIRHLSALMIAAQEGHLPTVELLLKAGADTSLSPRHQRTALHLAASGGHLKVVQALVAQGADVNARSRVGCTSALEAAQFDRRDVVAFLLEQGTNPGFQDGEGLTVADWLAQGGVQGRSKRLFPDPIGTSPKAVANATRKVRQLMAEGLSADEYAAKHGRHILIWGYGHKDFEDSEVKAWAQRVAEVLFTPDLLAQCEERHLQGEALEDARRCRARRARSAARRAKRNPETAP